jgi:hypothetical protein
MNLPAAESKCGLRGITRHDFVGVSQFIQCMCPFRKMHPDTRRNRVKCDTPYMKLFHFSLERFTPGEHLVGMKAAHKAQQRVGQALTDEIFDRVRKTTYPAAPSLFASLWLTSKYDASIARKQFIENPDNAEGFLYAVEPLGAVYEIDPEPEIEACRAVTWSGLKGGALDRHIAALAETFWHPEPIPREIQFYLAVSGASVTRLARVVQRDAEG